MKKTKILVPALAVLALGMAASVTGTVAWYAANIEVVGSGMQINCATSKNLVITNSLQASWAASASASNAETTTLSPVSTTDFDNNAKYFKVADASKVDYNTGRLLNDAVIEAALPSQITESGNNGFVRMDTFYVKLDALNSEKINLRIKEITVNRHVPTSEISKALRMGIFTSYTAKDNTNAGTPTAIDQIYAPFGNGANVTYDALKATGTVDNQVLTNGAPTVTAYKQGETALTESTTANYQLPANNTVLVENFHGGDVLMFRMYFWLEGTDANCTSAKSVNVDDIDISITFDYPNTPANNG